MTDGIPGVHHATVIGGAGFIGRHLVTRLRADGWDCDVPGRDQAPLAGDLGHVFYCAGVTGDFGVRPFDTVESHVTVLSHLLQQASFTSLVYLSSTRLYDSSGTAEADETTQLVLDPQNPRHIYDLSKALGEALCHRTGGGKARVARLSNVYGRGPDDGGGFLSEVVRLANNSSGPDEVSLDTSQGSGRDYVAVDDVVDALVAIATRGTQPVYNVASGAIVTNAELFDAVRRESGAVIRGTQGESPAQSPRVVIDRMIEEFNWQPVQLLDELPTLLGR